MKSLDRLSRILESLNVQEYRRLKLFLGHLRNNRKQRTIAALEVIQSQLIFDKYKNEKELQGALGKAIFKKTKTNELQLKNYLLDILLEVERYLVYDLMGNDNYSRFRFLADVTEYRNLHELNYRTLIDQKKLLKQKFQGNIWYYGYNFELSYKQYIHPFQNKYIENQDRVPIEENLDNALDFFLIVQLRSLCEAVIFKESVHPIVLPNLLLSEVIIEKSKVNPTIKLYYQTYLLLTNSTNYQDKELIELYCNCENILIGREKSDFLLLIINYTSIQINKTGDKNYLKLLRLLHKTGFPLDSYKAEHGKLFIEPTLYINIVQVSLLFDEIEWAGLFIETYKNFLPNIKNDSTYLFCKAIIFFREKNYSQAAPILASIKSDDFALMLKIKSYFVMIQFESEFLSVGDRTLVWNAINVLQSEFGKHEKTEVMEGMYSNFIDYVHSLMKKKPKLDELLKNLENTPYIASKTWLIEQINNLKKKRILF